MSGPFNLYSRPRQPVTSAFRKDAYPVRFLIVDKETGAILGETQRLPRLDPTLPNRIAVPAKVLP